MGALRRRVERVHRLAAADEQPVAALADEGEVGAALGHQDLAELGAVGSAHMHAVNALAAKGEAPSTCWLKIAKGGMLPVLRGSCDIADLGPGCEGSPPGSPVFGGGDVITAEIKEIVDLIVGREKLLCLTG